VFKDSEREKDIVQDIFEKVLVKAEETENNNNWQITLLFNFPSQYL
jgi:hypothetical protein